jgi:hypothetical protein
MSDLTTYTDTALYAEMAGRESTLGLEGMASQAERPRDLQDPS